MSEKELQQLVSQGITLQRLIEKLGLAHSDNFFPAASPPINDVHNTYPLGKRALNIGYNAETGHVNSAHFEISNVITPSLTPHSAPVSHATEKTLATKRIQFGNLDATFHPVPGLYYIVSVKNDLCIDVTDDQVTNSNGEAFALWPRGDQYQKWYITPDAAAPGAYSIMSILGTNKYLQPKQNYGGVLGLGVHSIMADGQPIHWYAKQASSFQEWAFVPSATKTNAYVIVNLGTGLVLQCNPLDKTLFQTTRDDQVESQHWYLQPTKADLNGGNRIYH